MENFHQNPCFGQKTEKKDHQGSRVDKTLKIVGEI